MKIVMISPEYPVTFWSFKHALRFVSKKAAYPPLGLLTVAALLPKDWDIRLVDLNISKLQDKDIKWADYVMISAMVVQKASVHEVLDRCRQHGVKIIAGGPLFSSELDVFKDLVDYLILGEAELTMPLFLEDLENGKEQKIYRSDEKPDLALTPVPRWDLINLKHYATLMVQLSRGCPFNCDFCDITNIFGRRTRSKSPEQLLEELDTIYNMGWRSTVFFVDDNFIGNKVAIKKTLRKLIEWMQDHDHPFDFLTEVSINLADDDELIELMVNAGFDTVFVGLETPDENSLRECEKVQNLSRNLVDSIGKLQQAGLQVHGGYIVGFDNDDETIFSRQIKFIQESGVVTAMVGLLNAMPNTKLWHRLKAENRLLLHSTGNNTDGTINFIPKMEMNNLIDGYRRMVKTIYSPRHYYRRLCYFLERYEPKRKKKLSANEVKAFFKTTFYLGVLGNGISQWYYWKMLFKSLLFHRKSFSEAMILMVYGYHFRKVAKKL
jgi:radical SAM superfamily enzyme YgiQ (UPF0313 family)